MHAADVDDLDDQTGDLTSSKEPNRPAEPPGYRSNALLIYDTMRQRIATRTYSGMCSP